jgi:hypothetical protein
LKRRTNRQERKSAKVVSFFELLALLAVKYTLRERDFVSMPKMNEDTPEITVVFLNAVVQHPNMRLIEKPQNMLFELTAAFTRNNFHQGDPFCKRLLNDPVQLFVDLAAVIIDVV